MRFLGPLLALALLAGPTPSLAWGSGSSSLSRSKSTSSNSRRRSVSGSTRHSQGKTKRDPEQRRAFMRSHPCPSTGKGYGACPGYVVDHVQALKHGGADRPENMQWQTVEDAKAKDKWE